MGDRLTADVVVIGAGLGGLVAAITAQEDGSRVICLEKLAEPGGSFALSGGYIWALSSFEAYREQVPDGDPVLGRLVIEDFETGIEWLQDHGVRLEPLAGAYWDPRQARRVRPETVSAGVIPLARALEAAGGSLVLGAACLRMLSSESGEIRGVVYRDASGVHEIDCRAVVMATGGFQGDRELLARYVGPWADRAWIRSNPGSTGDGLRMALDAGASVSRGMGMFYGHLLPAPPIEIESGAFGALAARYAEHCILVNSHGRRFVDESRRDNICAQFLAREEGGTGFVIFDRARYESYVLTPHVPDAAPYDPLLLIPDRGGVVLEASTSSELASQLFEIYGVPPRNLEDTIAEFNSACAANDPRLLEVPRRTGLHSLSSAPFYAIPVRPGVTFTTGGVRVNESCEALDRDGSPIPGIFVAGADVGAISLEMYVGGLSAALVTGLRAGIYGSQFAARALSTPIGTASRS
jgi:succinate dehydrogenase/fumarate reductase flavoprotein subunit